MDPHLSLFVHTDDLGGVVGLLFSFVFSFTHSGTCLAWSCCEELLQRGCFTLFATHFQQMIQLQDLYPNRVLNHHLRVDVAQASAGGLRFLHSLCRESLQEPLPPQEEVLAHHYGILLARHLGWCLHSLHCRQYVEASCLFMLQHRTLQC